MSARLFSFVIWLVVAATAMFWATRLLARPAPVPAHAAVAALALPQGGDLTRLFGAPPPPAPVAEAAPEPAEDARFKLLGVVAPAAGQHQGLALIAVDGRTPRAVGVGGRVEGELVLRSISHRRVELGPADGAPTVVLELPLLAEAARGALPPAQTEAPPMPAPGAAPPVVPRIAPAGLPPMRPAAPPPRVGQVQPGIVPPQPAPFGVTPQATPVTPIGGAGNPGSAPGELPTR